MNNKRLMKVFGLLLEIGLIAVFSPLTRAQARTTDMFSISDWTIDGLVVDDSGRPVISPQEIPPAAYDMQVSTLEDIAVVFTLDANDGSSGAIVTGPTHGAVTIDSQDRLKATYTPEPNYHGTDSFTYWVTDGELWSNFATVEITVTPVNDAPVANDMTETTAEDTAKTIILDATDIDSNTLTAEILSGGPTHGQVSLSGLVVTYTPNANYYGPDSFTYRVSDGDLWSDTATVSITVTPLPRIYLPIIFR